ncbi:hypothetical protein RDI58_028582 [Solanum bulbocastanum]|uniref:Uncharacterized protein n=1 Tax=Solanum bulbocastanum TaxID=147425 RepID=A0AAN8SS81_SOLBU
MIVQARSLGSSNQSQNDVASPSQLYGIVEAVMEPNFRSLLDWHKPPFVVLLETKM